MTRLFDAPVLLVLVVLLPLAVGAMLTMARNRRADRLARMGGHEVVARLLPADALGSATARLVLLSLAALFAALAVAGPRWGSEVTRIAASGVDIVLAVDASLSMMATDERPNRLERVKQEIRRLRASSRGDRVGVIAFAGRSYILTPLTTDEGALDLFVENLDPSIVGQAGSAVSRAIRQGSDLLLASQSASDRALVVMSDWESFEEDEAVIEAARAAGEAGISLIAVGFGSDGGSRIPIASSPSGDFKLDEDGRVVVTRHNPALMRAAAEAAGGVMVGADETDKAARIRRALSTLREQKRAVNVGRDRTARFQLFLIPALLLVLADTILAERRRSTRRMPALSLRAARRAATASLAALLVAPQQPGSGSLDQAAALMKAERYAEAIAEFRRRIQDGDQSERTLYNLGTALLRGDSLAGAAEVLGRLVKAEDEEIRYRALFNLGLAQLESGLRKQGPERSAALEAALESYRNVLLMRSGDQDAKWNYELALSQQEQGGGGGGGSAQEQESAGESRDSEDESQQSDAQSSLGREQAEQILDNAARDERDVQARSRDRSRPSRPPGGKDW